MIELAIAVEARERIRCVHMFETYAKTNVWYRFIIPSHPSFVGFSFKLTYVSGPNQ